MKNKFFQKIFKKIVLVIFIFQLAFLPFLPQIVRAENQSQALTTQTDWQAGTADTNTEVNQTPGELELKENKTTYTETTKEDFLAGSSPIVSLFPTVVSEEDDGEVGIDQWWNYTTATTPAIGDNYTRHTFLDSANDLLYVSTNGGLSVISTQGTTDPADDTLIKTYATATTPAIGGNNVNNSFIDSARNLIYISTYGGGLSVIDTQGTVSPVDDTLVKTYTTATSPTISSNYVQHTLLDSVNNLLYISTYNSGLSVINTQGTVSPADDTLVKTYTTSTTPAIGNDYLRHSFLDTEHNLIYVSTSGGGLSVINTQGTVSPADDTLVKTYTTSTTPAIGSNYVIHSFLDTEHNLIYVSTNGGGLSVINTQGTISPNDDTLVKTYTTSTTPAISYNAVFHTFLDSANSFLYVSGSGGLSVINTQSTIDPSDDVLVKTYDTSNTPAIGNTGGNSVFNSFLDSDNNLIYVNTSGGLSVGNLNDKYNNTGEQVSRLLRISDIPTKKIAFQSTLPIGTSVTIQTRTGDTSAAWVDNFDDNSTAEYVGDYYDWGCPFDNAVESDGTLKLSGISTACGSSNKSVFNWVDTGKPEGYFPPGSVVTARIRVNSNREFTSYYDYIFNNEWDDDAKDRKNNEWMILQFVSTVSFSKLGFETDWVGGTWNEATDNLEIDYIKIELPDSYWNTWSTPCENQSGCPIDEASLTGKDWFQYKLNLTTTDTNITPSVNSVTLSAGYNSSATYLTKVIDATRTADWQTLNPETTLPAGTSISYQTRSGQTLTPDETWSEWAGATELNISSPNSRYIQIKAILETTDENQTPVLSALQINYNLTEQESISDPTPEKLLEAISQGLITFAGEDPTETESFTFTADTILATGKTAVTFPQGTTVTKTGGGTIDLSQLVTENLTNQVKSSLDDTLGALRIGIPNLNLTFSQKISLTIPVGNSHNGKTLKVLFRRETETTWNDETTCKVQNGNCTFETNHATTFTAQKLPPEEAQIDSWDFSLTTDQSSCPQKLELILKGKNFTKNAQVKIGNEEASEINKKSSKKIVAKFCLEKLLKAKTLSKRTVSVKNPDTDTKKAKKKFDLNLIPQGDLNPNTEEGLKNIQRILIKEKFLSTKDLTGRYDQVTINAIKAFQKQNNLPETGIVGVMTKRKLVW